MSNKTLQDQIDEATLDFAIGDNRTALSKLKGLTQSNPDSFEAWHALTEVLFSQNDYKAALTTGEQAFKLQPKDVYINTSLSRIWMELGDKKQAEHYGAQARILGWKDELKAGNDSLE